MRQTILFFSLVLFVPLADLAAKEIPLIAPGAKVRLYAPSLIEGHFVGKVVRLNADTMTVALGGRRTPLQVPMASVESLEIYQGTKRKTGKGMAIGTTIGASIGAFVGYGLSKAFDDAFDDGYEEGNSDRSAYLRNAAKGAFFIGLPGALIGAGIGASYRDEQWKKVQIDSIYMGIAPQRGGVQIAASFRF
ncbi:MAG: hypothetical protein EXS64_16130 [Candidatus Latescibacteria bacterium]|nr:hypothetical protein [Candidatus Latescibacterota bacterium]